MIFDVNFKSIELLNVRNRFHCAISLLAGRVGATSFRFIPARSQKKKTKDKKNTSLFQIQVENAIENRRRRRNQEKK